jgi:hypothetical protein
MSEKAYSAHDFPGLVDDGDCLHHRHLGGIVLIRYDPRRPASRVSMVVVGNAVKKDIVKGSL